MTNLTRLWIIATLRIKQMMGSTWQSIKQCLRYILLQMVFSTSQSTGMHISVILKQGEMTNALKLLAVSKSFRAWMKSAASSKKFKLMVIRKRAGFVQTSKLCMWRISLPLEILTTHKIVLRWLTAITSPTTWVTMIQTARLTTQ